MKNSGGDQKYNTTKILYFYSKQFMMNVNNNNACNSVPNEQEDQPKAPATVPPTESCIYTVEGPHREVSQWLQNICPEDVDEHSCILQWARSVPEGEWTWDDDRWRIVEGARALSPLQC